GIRDCHVTGVQTCALPISPAVDTELQGGDGGNPREYFSVLLRISDGLICDWESFETYPVGAVWQMEDGGDIWDGPAVLGNNYWEIGRASCRGRGGMSEVRR